jgi:Protein of unknown function (DUF2878)
VGGLRKALHFIGMQGAWFAAALLASTPWHLVGALANVVFVGAHLTLSGNARRELERAGLALLFGLGIELVNQYAGHVHAQQAGVLPPLWLWSLWPAFASAFMEGHSLSWLKPRPFVAAALGAVLGPLSYAGGARLGALELDGAQSLVCLSLTWACAMVALSRR